MRPLMSMELLNTNLDEHARKLLVREEELQLIIKWAQIRCGSMRLLHAMGLGNYHPEYDEWYAYNDRVDVNFYINDQDSYIYYGCNANGGPEDEFFAGYGHLNHYKCPLLSIYPRVGQELTSLFGNKWKPVFKEWFEEKSGLHVTQITDDYI